MNLDIFESHLLSAFQELAEDKVRNVRISVALAILKHRKKNGRMKDDPRIKRIEEKLNTERSILIH
jgi:hypothetical protein